MREVGAFWIGGAAATILWWAVFISCLNKVETRHELARRGYAEYYIDKDFKRQWRWLPVAQKPKDTTPSEREQKPADVNQPKP